MTELTFDQKRDYADLLVYCDSPSRTAGVLREILEIADFDDWVITDVVEALADVVTYGVNRSANAGRKMGDFSARSRLVGKLGLGTLAPEGGERP